MNLPEHWKERDRSTAWDENNFALDECTDDCPRCAVDKALAEQKQEFKDLIKQRLEETCAIVKDGKQTRSGVSVLAELLKELEG
jgi:hypothetical protein